MHAHPEDLRLILARRNSRENLSWREIGMMDAFIRVCDLLEPDLIWSAGDEVSRVEWLTTLAHVRSYLVFWSAPPPTRDLKLDVFEAEQLASLAAKAWRGPSKGPHRPLPFIKNSELRAIAERDLGSLSAARRADEVKVALVLAGSIIEAILVDIVSQNPTESEAAARGIPQLRNLPTDMSRWTLVQMISVCGPQGLRVLSDKTKDIANTVRDWRNFVHPEKERAETRNNPLKPSDAAMAEALVEKVIDEVRLWAKPQLNAAPESMP